MADHLLLSIDVDVNGNKHGFRFFVKKFPETTFAILQKYIEESRLFPKEIFVYGVLIPRLKDAAFSAKTFPCCYYIEEDTIILEDLSEKGYKICTVDCFDDAHIELTLQVIASLHAASIAYEECISSRKTKPYTLINDFPEELRDGINRNDEDFTGYLYLKAAHNGLLRAVDLLHFNKNNFKAHLNKIFNDIFVVLTTSRKYKNVFNHGDLWHMNILFKYENNIPKFCKLVDFQLVRYAPPANDVLYFLLHALKGNVSRLQLQRYLLFYYEKLTQHLRDHGFDLNRMLPVEEFQITCNLLLPSLKLKHSYQVMLQYANQTYMKHIYRDSELYRKCLFEDRSEMVEQMVATDDGYRKVVRGLLDGLHDIIEEKISGSNHLF